MHSGRDVFLYKFWNLQNRIVYQQNHQELIFFIHYRKDSLYDNKAVHM